jgi:hypothetical protein
VQNPPTPCLKGVGFLRACLLAALPSRALLPPCERDARAPSTRCAGNAGVPPAMPTARGKTYPFKPPVSPSSASRERGNARIPLSHPVGADKGTSLGFAVGRGRPLFALTPSPSPTLWERGVGARGSAPCSAFPLSRLAGEGDKADKGTSLEFTVCGARTLFRPHPQPLSHAVGEGCRAHGGAFPPLPPAGEGD